MEKIAASINEAAEALSIGRTTLYALIGDGRLQTFKVGRRTLVRVDSLRALLNDPRATALQTDSRDV